MDLNSAFFLHVKAKSLKNSTLAAFNLTPLIEGKKTWVKASYDSLVKSLLCMMLR